MRSSLVRCAKRSRAVFDDDDDDPTTALPTSAFPNKLSTLLVISSKSSIHGAVIRRAGKPKLFALASQDVSTGESQATIRDKLVCVDIEFCNNSVFDISNACTLRSSNESI